VMFVSLLDSFPKQVVIINLARKDRFMTYYY
jgi:hypothetical protein